MSLGRGGLQPDENLLDMHADRWRWAEPDQTTAGGSPMSSCRTRDDSDAPGRLRAEGEPGLEEAIGRQTGGRWQQEAKLASGD